MPSGSKKRKSAKRKKENDSNNHLHPHSLRGEEEEIGPVDSISNLPSVERLKNEGVDDRVTLLYNEPRATADGGAENGKHSGVTEPLLTPRQPTRTASWKSCCGLFAMFTGPGR